MWAASLMVTNPYTIRDLDMEVPRLLRQYKPDDLFDDDTGDFAIVVDTLAAGTEGTHIPRIEADHFGLELPEGVESWDEYEWLTEDVDAAENQVADELNAATSLRGRYGFETNEGFGDRQLTFRFDRGSFPEWEGTCMTGRDIDVLLEQLEGLKEHYNIPEIDALINAVSRLPKCD